MTFSDEKLNKVWDKTGGRCYYCDKQLAWVNYGKPNGRGSWEVDHSLPISKGGTNHLNNLVPACTSCNKAKGDMTASQFKKTIRTPSETPLADLVLGMLIIGGLLWGIKTIFNPK